MGNPALFLFAVICGAVDILGAIMIIDVIVLGLGNPEEVSPAFISAGVYRVFVASDSMILSELVNPVRLSLHAAICGDVLERAVDCTDVS